VPSTRERRASGREALHLVTELLHRIRLAEPTVGVWEAADFQWWWRTPRPSDAIDQRFWLDGEGPLAAAMLTEWKAAWSLDPIVLPGAPRSLRLAVWDAGMAAIEGLPRDLPAVSIETRVRAEDPELAAFLEDHRFGPAGAGGTAWMDASKRPSQRPAPEGFEIVDRRQRPEGAHWMIGRNGPAVESRLRETSLYDPGLDLAVRGPRGEIAGYALFWFDPVTRVGMLEPMRVEDAWQRRGLARALISEGLDRLAHRGATRMKVSFESEAAQALYLGAGFELESMTTLYVRPSGPTTGPA
jgi:predicted N-acetyltransferase YhbS